MVDFRYRSLDFRIQGSHFSLDCRDSSSKATLAGMLIGAAIVISAVNWLSFRRSHYTGVNSRSV